MIGKYPVITLCGSTRFKDQFLEAQKRLTLAGNIVIKVTLPVGSKRIRAALFKEMDLVEITAQADNLPNRTACRIIGKDPGLINTEGREQHLTVMEFDRCAVTI